MGTIKKRGTSNKTNAKTTRSLSLPLSTEEGCNAGQDVANKYNWNFVAFVIEMNEKQILKQE